MWPLIYKANRDKIRDPDLIYPKQVFAIPRNFSQEEANTAIRRARTRGPWRSGMALTTTSWKAPDASVSALSISQDSGVRQAPESFYCP